MIMHLEVFVLSSCKWHYCEQKIIFNKAELSAADAKATPSLRIFSPERAHLTLHLCRAQPQICRSPIKGSQGDKMMIYICITFLRFQCHWACISIFTSETLHCILVISTNQSDLLFDCWSVAKMVRTNWIKCLAGSVTCPTKKLGLVLRQWISITAFVCSRP